MCLWYASLFVYYFDFCELDCLGLFPGDFLLWLRILFAWLGCGLWWLVIFVYLCFCYLFCCFNIICLIWFCWFCFRFACLISVFVLVWFACLGCLLLFVWLLVLLWLFTLWVCDELICRYLCWIRLLWCCCRMLFCDLCCFVFCFGWFDVRMMEVCVTMFVCFVCAC